MRSVPLAWMLGSLLVASASGATPAEATKTLSPYFVVEGGDSSVERLPLEENRIHFEVSGVIANVKVIQTYQNRGTEPINAEYVFPASTRAAVHGMTMRVGDRVIEARIKEREQARQVFEQAKREGKSASLLEQDRPNVFRMNVANVLPGDRIEVELRYTELIVPTDGTYEWVAPTVVGPRYSNTRGSEHDRFIQSPYTTEGKAPSYGFTLSGHISTGIPLQELGSPSHLVNVRWKSPSLAEVQLDPSEKQGGNRDFILRYRLKGKEIQSGLIVSEGRDENFFLLMVQPPARVRREQIPAREYVFIVDVSGSMRGFPLETAKRVMAQLLADLRPQDRFNVLLFSGFSELLSKESLPATPENVSRALALVDQQSGGGGTELLPALRRALSLAAASGMSRNFVVVTDGYIGAEKEMFAYVRENLGDANVYSFGIGSSVNRYLVDGLAKAGLGEAFVVTAPSVAAREAQRFAEYVRAPVLTDVRVRAEGVELVDVEPRSIPDVLADRPVVIHGKWKGRRTGKVQLAGQSGEGPFQATFDLGRAPRGMNEGLRYLWARSRIAHLSDFGTAPADAVRQEVTELGLRYNLLTPFTSFVAVHEVRRTNGQAVDVKQPLPLPEGVSHSAVGGGLQVGDEPELLWVLVAAVFMLFAVRRRILPEL